MRKKIEGEIRTTEKCGHEVADAVEEEELRDDEGFHEHHCAGDDDRCQCNDVQKADYLEHDVSWTGQGALEERHYGDDSWCWY